MQLSQSYCVAIYARIIGGLFNGNLGVTNSFSTDITVESNNTFAFSRMAIAFGARSIFGSVAGDMLYDIPSWIFSADYTPQKCSFPYLIPCSLASFIAIISFISCYIYVIDVKDFRKEYFGTKDIAKNGNKDIELKIKN